MPCNNGQTYLNSLVPVPGGTAADATYVLNLTHYTCGNRKVCVNGSYPITANLAYQVLRVNSVGNGAFNADILVSGTCTYMPHRTGSNYYGCDCNSCPVTDNIWTVLSVPVSSADIPTLTAGTCVCSPTNVSDCCNTTNAVSITTSLNVAAGA